MRQPTPWGSLPGRCDSSFVAPGPGYDPPLRRWKIEAPPWDVSARGVRPRSTPTPSELSHSVNSGILIHAEP